MFGAQSTVALLDGNPTLFPSFGCRRSQSLAALKEAYFESGAVQTHLVR